MSLVAHLLKPRWYGRVALQRQKSRRESVSTYSYDSVLLLRAQPDCIPMRASETLKTCIC